MMNRSTTTSHLQRRLIAILLVTIAGVIIILTFTSQLEKKNNLLNINNNHDDRRTRRRRLQGVMGDQGGGLLHHLDPKTIELKGQQQGTNMLYIPPDSHGNGELALQQQAQQFQQLQPVSPGFSDFNQQYQVPPQQQQFQPQPLQQQPMQQFAQPQIQQQESINTIVNTNTNNLVNPYNIVASNTIQAAPQSPQESAAAIIPSATIANNNFPPSSPPLTIKPYNINNILQALKSFRYQGFFFIYDSASNEFVIMHATPTCDLGCVRIYRIASIIAFALRKNFPERFPSEEFGGNGSISDGGSGDLVFAISTGDVPRIHQYCLSIETNYCSSADFGPILQFGSIFVNTDYTPSMIAMPQPVRPHMPCFDEWQLYGRVCAGLQPAQVTPADDPSGQDGGEEFTGLASFASGLVFGQELGLISKPNYWNELIPQIIWRGTDFVFLHTMFPKMRRPDYEQDIAPKESTRLGGENKRWAIDALWEMGEKLQPRWRGVLLTSEAELEAEEFREAGDATLPWVNIKFASCNFNRKKVDASENPDFVKLQSVGIKAIGERVNMQEQAKYRYHIDLGGGGGTSWTGTIEKLALPGVLFHHVTPTKDWFYDRLQPWVHYIPVNSDLTDLREKFEWAESHPVEAQKIAEAGTEFARWIGTPEGFGELYQQHLVAPLKGIIDAYQPSPDASDAGKSALDIIKERGSPEYTIVSRCSGSKQYTCKDLNGKIPN